MCSAMKDLQITELAVRIAIALGAQHEPKNITLIESEIADYESNLVEVPISPKVADNDISNWEVYHSNSGNTGICYNHPKAGDESVMIRNKVTKKFSFLQLNK